MDKESLLRRDSGSSRSLRLLKSRRKSVDSPRTLITRSTTFHVFLILFSNVYFFLEFPRQPEHDDCDLGKRVDYWKSEWKQNVITGTAQADFGWRNSWIFTHIYCFEKIPPVRKKCALVHRTTCNMINSITRFLYRIIGYHGLVKW